LSGPSSASDADAVRSVRRSGDRRSGICSARTACICLDGAAPVIRGSRNCASTTYSENKDSVQLAAAHACATVCVRPCATAARSYTTPGKPPGSSSELSQQQAAGRSPCTHAHSTPAGRSVAHDCWRCPRRRSYRVRMSMIFRTQSGIKFLPLLWRSVELDMSGALPPVWLRRNCGRFSSEHSNLLSETCVD